MKKRHLLDEVCKRVKMWILGFCLSAIVAYIFNRAKEQYAGNQALPFGALIVYAVVLFHIKFNRTKLTPTVVAGLIKVAKRLIMIIAGLFFYYRLHGITGPWTPLDSVKSIKSTIR